ncbi:tetratricopeptide repeat protein 27-like [Coccinella septempunctata]|uniref:tetratricopeptide repeat protein 27-like n=1 Tax=Coccinella septempunctata TaxID=41139 RepID=UPI001D06FFD1|nr:tetratricopeptide repeat protein 27-like [Coccinella septempunctata]
MENSDVLIDYFLFIENNKEIEDGNYPEALELMNRIQDVDIWHSLIERSFDTELLKEYFSTLSSDKRSNVFKFGISCFVHFVQANFTGPELTEDVTKIFNIPETSKYTGEFLFSNHDEINVNTKFPILLYVSKCIFQNCSVEKIVNLLWTWRSLIIHQQIMEELSPLLLSVANELKMQIDTFNLQAYTRAKFDLEFAQLYLILRHISKSNKHIDSAENILGIRYNLGGKLGKRTKYQAKDLAQMTLDVTLSDNYDIKRPPIHDFQVPKNITLNDDVRLDKIQFVEPRENGVQLPNTEQKVLLTRVQEIIMARPKTELIEEEVLPFFDLILSQKNTWAVRVVTLMLRCEYENSIRTINRKIAQCEEILECFRSSKPHVLNRFADVFSSGLKPMWKVQSVYAEALRLMGLIKDSLNIYIAIQDWESVIVCYTLLGLRHNAAEVIKQQLDKKETPKMWCLLGDATDDITCYEKAWELSNEKSHMARRHWGNFLFERKKYEECVPHFETSVAINPLQPPVWLRLGYAALQIQNWQLAATAYIRYTHLEPEGFQAWNNLAQAYIKMGHNKEAHSALAEALKYDFENWQIWENYLIVSCDISSYSNIIRAYHKILDLERKYINIAALKILVFDACSNCSDEKNSKDVKDDEKPDVLLKQTKELLGRITSIDSSQGYVWEMYASLCPPGSLRAERLQKAFRAYTQLGWDKNPQNCVKVLCLCMKIAELLLSDELEFHFDLLNSARLHLRAAIAAVKKHNWEDTKALVEEVSDSLEKLTQKVKSLQPST